MAVLKRIGVIKMASFMGLYGAAIGLIAGIIMALVSSLISSTVNTIGGGSISSFGEIGWYTVIAFPLVYGIMGFIGGLILTPIVNLILKIIKGIDLDLETKQEMHAPVQEHYEPYHPPLQEQHQQYQYRH